MLFAIFGLTEDFLCILQVLSTFENCLNQIKTGLATWRVLTGQYRFGWIGSAGH
jgi:hypothetical protein